MRNLAFVLGIAPGLGGCGSDPPAAALAGTIHGVSFSLRDSASGEVTVTAAQLHGGGILMTSSSGTCADIDSNQVHRDEQAVFIVVWDVVGTTTNAPTVPGTYSIYQGSGTSPPKGATFSAHAYDSACTEITNDAATATAGTVTLTSVSGTKYAGKFDVALDSGDHVTGSFDPLECPALDTYISPSDNKACI